MRKNAAKKLGSDAVNVTFAGCVWSTNFVQNTGPTGESHW
jgi:hypothetical protein